MHTRHVLRVASAALSLLLMVMAAVPSAQAQMMDDEPLTSDRPGLSNGAATVNSGTFQTELGYELFQNTTGEETLTTHSIGQILARYGATDAIELRANIGSVGFAETFAETDTELESGYVSTGLSDRAIGPSIGVKARLFQTEMLTVSGFTDTSVPSVMTGPFETVDERSRQTFALFADGAISENITLTVNGGTSFYWSSGEQDDRAFSALFIPTLNFSINDEAGAYVGYLGEYDEFANRNFVEGGFTYLLSGDTQLDINGGYRIDDNADGYFLGLGVSQRF